MTNPPDREIIVFSAARRLPPGQRAAYLDEACGGDTALRQRVEELLRARDEAGAFLESPASGPAGTDRITPIRTEKVGDRIGRYKLLQQIGEGGCGVVYMAEQEEPVHRQVALKVIKLGMDTKQVIARFEAERQALALMDHPNIAKVLDAGATETGRPYFVMELVRGIKITDYCDQNALSTQERLDLFIQVCRAIQHAHQKGIIHRDIKPSNILVTMDDRAPVPKVIDFGIAKATQGKLTDRTLFTAFEQFIGTPAYMSPEQAEMKVQDIDTRSDIYSLGVLLYELLTGRTPFDPKELLAAGVEEMRRIIREKEPARPSTRLSTMMAAELTTVAGRRQVEAARLAPLIRGDLDWIVMKSLEKDRSRRYETTNGLASDIRCHLNNEPVTARPPNNFYKLRKFARRNRSILITAGIIVVLLLIGFRSVVLMSAREQTAREQVKTEQRIAESEASARDESDDDFKLLSYELIRELLLALNSAKRDQFEDAGPLLDKIIERVKTDLKDSPEIQAKMYNVLADAYDYSGSKDISKVDEQILWLRQQAVTIQRRLYGNDSLELAASLNGLGLAYDRRGDWAETCEPPLREALAIEMNRLGNQSAAAATTLGHLALVTSHIRFAYGGHDSPPHFSAALHLNFDALSIRRKLFGDESEQVFDSVLQLTWLVYKADASIENETTLRDMNTVESVCREIFLNNYSAYPNDSDHWQMYLLFLVTILNHEGKCAEANREFNAACKPIPPDNLLINGSFKFGNGPPGIHSDGISPLRGSELGLIGWSVGGSPVNGLQWIGPTNTLGLKAADGGCFINLGCGCIANGTNVGISQAISTIVGEIYSLTFKVGSDVRYDQGAVPGVTVELTGNPNRQFCVDVLGTNRWQLFNCCFTASNTNTSITFSAIKKVTGYYVGLDDVIVLPASSIAKSSNAKLP